MFCGLPPASIHFMRAMRVLGPVLGLPAVQRFLKDQVERRVPDPDETGTPPEPNLLWGEVRDAAGTRVAKRMRTPGGYGFTAVSSLAAAERVLGTTPDELPRGALTPSMAFGADFALEIEGVSVEPA